MLTPIVLALLSTGERIFIDTLGRQRFFHGTNAITKGPPWIASTTSYDSDISLVAEDFAEMQRQGINLLRLGIMWPGVEPVRQQYNLTYMQQVDDIVNAAAEYGIYTILDMHQDALSEFFCGEGIPTWAVIKPAKRTFPVPMADVYIDEYAEPKLHNAQLPTQQACKSHDWSKYYLSYDSAVAWESLYTNRNQTLDALAKVWGYIARYFKGNANILGMELLNEPFAGDIYAHPLLLVPWPNPYNADRKRLQPVYDRINAEIRQYDTERLLFFAGVTWDDAGPGFDHPPGGPAYANRSVLSYHYYQPPQFNTKLQIQAQVAGARRLKTGIFMTETCGGQMPEDLFRVADTHLQSWAYWEYKSFCKRNLTSRSQLSTWGACKTGTGPSGIHAHTFAPAVAGRVLSLLFNRTTKAFRLVYISVPHIPTEISTAYNYPNGYHLNVTPSSAIVRRVNDTLYIETPTSVNATVHITSI